MIKKFLNEYVEFVVDTGFSENSAAQYKSYLINTCKKISGMENHLYMIASSADADAQCVYAEEMYIALVNALKEDGHDVNPKKLRDYKCAVAVLIAYLSELDWMKGKGAVGKHIVKSAREYDKKDIVRIFLSRVKTQDRFSYDYGVFPARILCKIAARKKAKIFNNMVDNVKLLISADKYKFVLLKQVDKLIIDTKGYVYVSIKNKIHSVYTEVVEEGISKGYEKLTVDGIKDISLDHDVPMYHAYKSALESMPEIKKLSKLVKNYRDANLDKNASKLSKDYFDNEYVNAKLSDDKIISEAGAFLDDTLMTVMHKSYNSSKGKSI